VLIQFLLLDLERPDDLIGTIYDGNDLMYYPFDHADDEDSSDEDGATPTAADEEARGELDKPYRRYD
jgi:hypothetical protein